MMTSYHLHLCNSVTFTVHPYCLWAWVTTPYDITRHCHSIK